MTQRKIRFGFLVCWLIAGPAWAEYGWSELQQIPLGRLIENMEQALRERPEDVRLVHNLARTHAMAYAWKVGGDEAVEAYRDYQEEGIWVDPYGSRLPFGEVVATDDAARLAEARAHLVAARALYQRALALMDAGHEPEPPGGLDRWVVRLGLAWCLEQLGEREEAIRRLRGIVVEAWATEGEVEWGGLRDFVTVEAARALIGLLDPAADEDEIEDLQEKVSHLESLPREITPLAIPLHADAAVDGLVDRTARVRFDLDGTGRQLSWEWITPDAGWLVFDPTGRGQVSSAVQLFGNRTFMLFLADGYAALTLLDDDGDGWLRGRELRGLSIWQDLDGDGVSAQGEVHPLTHWQITGLACHSERRADGWRWNPAGVELADGSRRLSVDLVLTGRE